MSYDLMEHDECGPWGSTGDIDDPELVSALLLLDDAEQFLKETIRDAEKDHYRCALKSLDDTIELLQEAKKHLEIVWDRL